MERTNISLTLKAAVVSFVLACATALCVALPGQAWAATSVGNSDELAIAIKNGETEISLEAGTYQMPAEAKGKTLKISSVQNATIEVVPAGQGEANGQLDYSLDGATVEFNGVTIKTNSNLYAGFARLSAVYNNCVIQNTYNLGTGTSEFNNCTFNITNEYLRVGGASSATFTNCIFNTDGRAILVFQDGTSVSQTVTVKNCTFNATAPAKTWNGIHVAAVSIDGSQGGTYTVNLEGDNKVDADFNGLWQIKADKDNVTVGECTIEFNSNGGSAVTSETVAAGETFAEPAAPTRDGYTFAGWYTDAELTQAYDFTTAAEGDITLYAKWTENSAPVQPGDGDSADPQQPVDGAVDPGTEDSKESEKTSTPKTGDATPFAAAAFGLIALIAAGALVATRKVL